MLPDQRKKPKPLKNLNGSICQICGETVGLTDSGDVVVACNECAFPVCRPCYERVESWKLKKEKNVVHVNGSRYNEGKGDIEGTGSNGEELQNGDFVLELEN
ncbi:hypothetical protein S83_019447 [Arachis hypogaea]|nr:cellulose synthase A catalytic subunit 1 [UDP-forming]-like [Arachis hypogaea]QHO46347.1 Cellulose synthase A catalytic subunit 1 [UDP-forming] [Arachis hypogaea]